MPSSLASFLFPVQACHGNAVRHRVQAAGTDLAVGIDAVHLGLGIRKIPSVGLGVLIQIGHVLAAHRGIDVGDAGDVRSVGRRDDARSVLLRGVVRIVGRFDRDVRIFLLERRDQLVVEGLQTGAVPQLQLNLLLADVGADRLGIRVGFR